MNENYLDKNYETICLIPLNEWIKMCDQILFLPMIPSMFHTILQVGNLRKQKSIFENIVTDFGSYANLLKMRDLLCKQKMVSFWYVKFCLAVLRNLILLKSTPNKKGDADILFLKYLKPKRICMGEVVISQTNKRQLQF